MLAQRPAHKRHGGLWEIPGGKLLGGENYLAVARRELDEEEPQVGRPRVSAGFPEPRRVRLPLQAPYVLVAQAP